MRSKLVPPERQVREVRMVWKGPIVGFMRDETRILDLEGAIRSGKTTACVWKVHSRLAEEPGLAAFLCRWTDGDTDSKLKPVWRAVCDAAGTPPKWNADEQYDELPNGSRAYVFGLKAADQTLRYSKLRGLTVAVIYNDQTEELPYDVFLELCGRLSQVGYRHQAIFSPNPTSPDHWLKDEFPTDNRVSGKKYMHLSIYDNAHNLAPGTIEGVLAAFPPGHAKHRPMVLGLRGLNVIGVPCYKDAFDRKKHERPIEFNPELPLCEGYDFGKHHPCWVAAQFPLGGGIAILGGVIGQNLWLEDFLPLVQQCRQQWFGKLPSLQTCCDPAGTHDHAHGTRDNALQVLKRFYPEHHRIEYKENSNAPDVRIALVERLAGHMRRRSPWGESLAVDGSKDLNGQYSRWLRVDKDGAEPWSFVSDGFEAGYVWDSHFVSVGSKQMRKPKKDSWYEHGQNCVEYLELNFGGAVATDADQEIRAQRAREREAQQRGTHRPMLTDPSLSWMG